MTSAHHQVKLNELLVGQKPMPMLDYAEFPLIIPAQRAKMSEAWIDNVYRGRAEPVAAVAGSGRKGSN